jgi:hypothetical protein
MIIHDREEIQGGWDPSPARVEKRKEQRTKNLDRFRRELSAQELELAEKRAQELARYAKKYSEINLHLHLTMPSAKIEATSRHVGTIGKEPLPLDPVKRLQLLRHLLDTMRTDTVEECVFVFLVIYLPGLISSDRKIKWVHVSYAFTTDCADEDANASETFISYKLLRMQELSSAPFLVFEFIEWHRLTFTFSDPHIEAHWKRMQEERHKVPSQSLTGSHDQAHTPVKALLKLPKGNIQTRPFETESYIRADDGTIIDARICGKYFLKEQGELHPLYFSVTGSLYTLERGRTFDIIREGVSHTIAMGEGELKSLLKGCVEVLDPYETHSHSVDAGADVAPTTARFAELALY